MVYSFEAIHSFFCRMKSYPGIIQNIHKMKDDIKMLLVGLEKEKIKKSSYFSVTLPIYWSHAKVSYHIEKHIVTNSGK